ncbi:MAG: NIPSNAP family protein, partial [Kibdelosporangium sp.]
MIVELRQYTLKPGKRDTLVSLFEQHLLDSQRAVGIDVLGQFYDLDDPDRFVWLRAFEDMAARKAALTAFYVQSEAWRTHGPAAGETMVDSSDVLLLRPAGPMFQDRTPAGRYTAIITDRPHSVPNPLAQFETEPAVNDFPGLPVRTDQAFVTFQAGD